MACDLSIILGSLSIGLYSVFAIFLIVLSVRMFLRDRRVSIQLLFLLCFFLFMCTRTVWLATKVDWYDVHLIYNYANCTNSTTATLPPQCYDIHQCKSAATFVLNRVTFCLYFTSLSLILFFWAEESRRTILMDARFSFLPSVRIYFIIVNGAVYVYQFIVIVIWITGSQSREGNLLYDTNILVDEILVFILALLFGFYGLKLYLKVRIFFCSFLILFLLVLLTHLCIAFSLEREERWNLTTKYLKEGSF